MGCGCSQSVIAAVAPAPPEVAAPVANVSKNTHEKNAPVAPALPEEAAPVPRVSKSVEEKDAPSAIMGIVGPTLGEGTNNVPVDAPVMAPSSTQSSQQPEEP